MQFSSKNYFEINDNIITIYTPKGVRLGETTFREDYIEELQSYTWSKNGNYIYSNKLKELAYIVINDKLPPKSSIVKSF